MISKDELLHAWEIISQFCKEQEHCSKCPMVMTCIIAFGTKPLDVCVAKVIGYISGLSIEAPEDDSQTNRV